MIRKAHARLAKLLYVSTDRGVPQLLAATMGLHALYLAATLNLKPQMPSFVWAFEFLDPIVWAMLYGLSGAFLLFAGWRKHNKQAIMAALLLCFLHSALGMSAVVVLVIPPMGDGFPVTIGNWIAYSALCYITQLSWRARSFNPKYGGHK